MKNELVLDVRELNGPFPILRTEKILQKMFPGQTVRVVTTDPRSATDFKSYCNETGNELVECSAFGDCYYYRIQKKK